MQNTQYLFHHKTENTVKTILLMGGSFLLIGLIGYALASQYGNINFIYAALIFTVFINFITYWFSAPIALKFSGAKPVDKSTVEGRMIYDSVARLAAKAKLPVPSVHIIQDNNPNAFATGRNASHAAVAVTSGLVHILNQDELDGVIAHELSHIGNKDILISSIVAVMAGLITYLLRMSAFNSDDRNNNGGGILSLLTLILAPIFATIIQLAVSRSREFQA
ncbi:MAG: M48 family metalloprotease, partial [Patescibacteria group bacterium]